MAKVILTPEAIEDILEIYTYFLERDGEDHAEAIVNRLERKAYSLEKFALRGKFPEELVPFGNRKIREVQETPWRIFFRVESEEVVVLSVLDGRRNMSDVFLKKLAR